MSRHPNAYPLLVDWFGYLDYGNELYGCLSTQKAQPGRFSAFCPRKYRRKIVKNQEILYLPIIELELHFQIYVCWPFWTRGLFPLSMIEKSLDWSYSEVACGFAPPRCDAWPRDGYSPVEATGSEGGIERTKEEKRTVAAGPTSTPDCSITFDCWTAPSQTQSGYFFFQVCFHPLFFVSNENTICVAIFNAKRPESAGSYTRPANIDLKIKF
jgi:hypothetical protein